MSTAAPQGALPVSVPPATRFAHLFAAEISDDDPDAFGENVEVVLALAREGSARDPLSVEDAKVLLRQLSLRFDARTGNQFYGRGIYQTFFSAIRAQSEAERERLEAQWIALEKTSRLLEKEALSLRSLRATLVSLWGALTEGLPEDDEEVPEARMMSWRVFESILRGVLDVEAFATADRTFHYAVIPEADRYRARLQDERRRILLEDFRFSVGDAYPRRPLLRRAVARDRALAPADRALLLRAVAAETPREVEPLAQILRHHAWLLACGTGESLAAYFRTVEQLLDHLLDGVLASPRDEWSRVMRVYLTLIRERHVGPLRAWCAAMRRARRTTPLLGDLLLEPYLLRAGLLRGAEEPGMAALLWDWRVVQRGMALRAGYDGPPFELEAAFRAAEGDWLKGGRHEAPEPGPRRRRRTAAYETFTQIPVVSAASPPREEGIAPPAPSPAEGREAWPSAPPPAVAPPVPRPGGAPDGVEPIATGHGDPDRNPFEDDEDLRATEPYRRVDGDLFDAITQQLPVIDAAAVDLSGATTLVLPAAEGTDLNRAATIILPATPSGAEEPGLHQARTLVFPVQSVPVTRNEAICRRVDLLLRQAEGSVRRSAEVLRAELAVMPDEDRIIAEQYLGQILGREMAWVGRRLRDADAMSVATLDDYAGSQLSGVLGRFGVSGYLRRVFLAECVALYGEFVGHGGLLAQVAESLQIAIFTVLNAHQDRLALPPTLAAELRAIGGFSAEDPLPTRLPYAFPEPVHIPRDLGARVARTGSLEAVFDVEYLLDSQVHELARTVEKVASLEIFADLEMALGAAGVTEEHYLDFVEELGDHIRNLVLRARRLFVHLPQGAAESQVVEQTLLDVIGYGRAVWTGCVFPALAFFGKMAFGVREGDAHTSG